MNLYLYGHFCVFFYYLKITKGPSDGTTSSFKSINFTKVTDETELNQWNKLVNSLSGVQNPVQTERTLSSIANLDPVQQIIDSLNKTNSNTDYYSVKSPNYEVSTQFSLKYTVFTTSNSRLPNLIYLVTFTLFITYYEPLVFINSYQQSYQG